MTCQSSPPPLWPAEGGPFDPPGRLDAVEPRSPFDTSGARAWLDELPLEPLVGVLNRFSAVAIEPLPEADVCPLEDAVLDVELELLPEDVCEAEDEDAEPVFWALLDVEEEDVEEVDDPAVPGVNVGLLEMAVVLARLAEGRDVPGLRLVPRSCGTSNAAKRSGDVAPVSRSVRSSVLFQARAVRSVLFCSAPFFAVAAVPGRRNHHAPKATPARAGMAHQPPRRC